MTLRVISGKNAFPSLNGRSSPQLPEVTATAIATGQPARSETVPCVPEIEIALKTASCCGCIPMSRTHGEAAMRDAQQPHPYAGAYNGPERFKVRELSHAEKYHYEKTRNDTWMRKLRISRLFEDQLSRLATWPRFFPDAEKSGEELRNAFATLWTTFILAESLLASIAMQPLISVIQSQTTITGWQLKVFGSLWVTSLIADYLSITVTSVFLGFLFANPPKTAYMFACNLGGWIGVPSFLVVASTVESIVAIGFSTWVIYGRTVGIFCTIMLVFVVWLSITAANALGRAAAAVDALD